MAFDTFNIDDFGLFEKARITATDGFECVGYIDGWTPEWDYDGEHDATLDYEDEETGLIMSVEIPQIVSIETKDRKFVYREP